MANAAQQSNNQPPRGGAPDAWDVVVVGAGFGGLYAVHHFASQGLSVLGLEGGGGVGGVWYHNRYPGARVDVDSFQYCFYFSPELYQDWQWSERYASQAELLSYLNHVADRFGIRERFRFNTWLKQAHWRPDLAKWELETSTGSCHATRFLVLATGNLSHARDPDFPGLAEFEGEWVQTSHWPQHEVAVAGKRIAVIGTGSSGVQAIPVLAETAAHLYVMQRTPNFVVPARNAAADKALHAQVAADVPAARAALFKSRGGATFQWDAVHSNELTQHERLQRIERQWQAGGQGMNFIFLDQSTSKDTNDLVAEFVRAKIRERVKNPVTAELLCPKDHAIGTRRLCLDTNYYETYNRENVTLVDVRNDPIERITRTGIQTRNNHYDVDLIVFALGFEAFRGAIEHIDIRNAEGRAPTDQWDRGPRTYLGLTIAGFPNLFMLTGPGSPSVLGNLALVNEFHVDFVAELIRYMDANAFAAVAAQPASQDEWTEHVADLAKPLLRNATPNYMVHVNADGSRYFIPYTGGFDRYIRTCEALAAKGYEGFVFTSLPAGAPGAGQPRAASAS
jgi:cation diffusion facilitator CzcD-associated flavoprotein CzcO